MHLPNRPLYAARLNAFKRAGHGTDTPSLIALAASVDGIGAADLNFPDQVSPETQAEVGRALEAHGIALNGLAMRYYGNDAYAIGAFTNPDPTVRQAAIDLHQAGDRLRGRDGRGSNDALDGPGRVRLRVPDRLRSGLGSHHRGYGRSCRS
ncbi:MAG: hypothetical protein AAGP08_09150 [Pseudomonadota bacterium]